jgi:ABC-type Fe3+/spermidine/putrescine transport system ATPase subunit
MLELRSVTKFYEGRRLLDGISFSLKAGETTCLLGASGSGKSTLLRMIAGLEPLEGGWILFNDADLAATPPHLRDFGLVFQEYALFPHLNVFENVAFGLRMQDLPEAEVARRVHGLLRQMNLAGMGTRRVTDLSGGEQQRVALARALAPRPRLLMFDEPLGALDRSLKEELLEDLRGVLKRAGIPALYVTHDQEEAFSISDRLLLLHEGRILRAGTPSEVWRHPGSEWVARFLGAGAILDGVIMAADRVRTAYGVIRMRCAHTHRRGEKVKLLLRQGRGAGSSEIGLTVEQVIVKRGQVEVRARGGFVVHLRNRPQAGQRVSVRFSAECLS